MSSEEVIELSIEETNALRVKLGLAPLRVDKDDKTTGTDDNNRKEDIHLPAPDMAKEEQTKSRIEEMKLAREVQSNLKNKFSHSTLGDNDKSLDAASWAERMRQQEKNNKSKSKKSAKKGVEKPTGSEYTSEDLEGIQVSHNLSSFQTNTNAILTLADENILEQNENNMIIGLNENHTSRLENIEMADAKKVKENLRKKRRIEMGQGHAGGYAAWDDDEFDEMGGIGVGTVLGQRNTYDLDGNIQNKESGFLIGQSNDVEEGETTNKQSLFFNKNQKVSLDSSGNVMASDFMTAEEFEQEQMELNAKKKKKKKEKGFKKSKKSKKKESKKKHRRKQLDDDDSDEENGNDESQKSSLLQDLESTAVESSYSHRGKRRVRVDDDDDDNENENNNNTINENENKSDTEMDVSTPTVKAQAMEDDEDDIQNMKAKRAKFDAVMEKGNQRSKQAFGSMNPSSSLSKAASITHPPKQGDKNNANSRTDEKNEEVENDDAFLNAALAKARRLQKLKRLHQNNTDNSDKNSNEDRDDEKAKSIVQALQSSNENTNGSNTISDDKGITFEFDATREFTRALRARDSQMQRQTKSKPNGVLLSSTNKKKQDKNEIEEDEPKVMVVDSEEEDEGDLQKLSEQISSQSKNNDDSDGLNFTSQSKLLVNRGLSSTLALLKTTGSLASNNTKNSSLQEKLRGRAKDYRNYEDYESLDLAKVTTIGTSHDKKDKEFTKREIKLEYRDEYGRLLTSKEAYRQMCYQFHGHGSGKRNEERRIKLIERERMEEAGGSSGTGDGSEKREGTLGALKATQRVTGKAFIVHKT